MKFLTFVLTAISVTLAVCGTGYSQPDRTAESCDCSQLGLDSAWADSNHITCYMVAVKRHFSQSNDSTFRLAVAIAPATKDSTREPILYLHGGPGIATLENLPDYLRSAAFVRFREDHDMVFFDYRGTGHSEPALCPELDSMLFGINRNALSLDDKIARSVAAYRDCRETLDARGVDLTAFSSLHSADDAESIRRALGFQHWNIYGVSHGTTVALHMMRTHPGQIRSVILDSPFPPNAPWSDYVHPFDTCFKTLEARLQSDTVLSSIFPSIRNDFRLISNRLRSAPIQSPSVPQSDNLAQPTATFKDTDFILSIWTAMLDPRHISLVPLALHEIAAGNDSLLLQWLNYFSDPNAYGAFSNAQSNAVSCYENRPRSPEETDEYLIRYYPEWSALLEPGLFDAICRIWRDDLPPDEYFDAVVSDIPTLIFSGELDPVCPPILADITARSLRNATSVVVPDESHAAVHADDCTRSLAIEFLQDPKVRPKTDCLSLRKPIEFKTSGPVILK